ncbi:hypothetical protein [Chromobacterium subtsugae]|uniref:hypothetical protein n=1 Tax=Chromobacterium subtsugae TaxID=251747 RepID=UPI0007F8B1BB|nr:hypothetical protein [Chromobacterium subtsugae]OBU85874.1 hypothetical protein MY55_13695 [Chromobacterium subtsugae]
MTGHRVEVAGFRSGLMRAAEGMADNYGMEDDESYSAGNAEGELAFAVAAALANRSEDPLPYLVRLLQSALLLRLGLSPERIPPDQDRLKGWIVGMFGLLQEAVVEQK